MPYYHISRLNWSKEKNKPLFFYAIVTKRLCYLVQIGVHKISGQFKKCVTSLQFVTEKFYKLLWK